MRVTGDVSVVFGADEDIVKEEARLKRATKAVRRRKWNCIVLR